MDPLTELLKTAQSETTPMRHRMRAAQQALRAMPTDAPEETWRPFRELFDEVVQHKPAYAEVLRTDALNVAMWWDNRRRPVIAEIPAGADTGGRAVPLGASLSKMRALMLDDGASLQRRIDAAEICVEYELGPGAGVGVPPDQIASAAYQFCRAVADSDAPEGHKFRALRMMVRIENARAKPSSAAQTAAQKALCVDLINAARRMELIKAGRWPPPAGTQWWLTMGDTFDMPALPSDPATAGMNIGQRLDHAKHLPEALRRQRRDARHAAYCAVRASNRVDNWQDLLVESAHDTV